MGAGWGGRSVFQSNRPRQGWPEPLRNAKKASVAEGWEVRPTPGGLCRPR